MGQQNIIKVLKKSARPLSREEIELQVKEGNVSYSLRQLLRYKEVKMILIPIRLKGRGGTRTMMIQHYYI